ncbi:MAG: hypothetical protein H6822_23160 [Planctomycetaceae bacterium]|nr:hypothetical protein [Planctomycetales bacterium]MCB9925097.1 hypothetical protein [Planctomycetaceae bacterium]
MIIILNDDPVYVSWIRRHRDGFVLDTRRKATKRNMTLHRAICPEIRKSKSKRTHWTTRGKVKACAENHTELTDWALEQAGYEPRLCHACNPLDETLPLETDSGDAGSERDLTKLENDILSAVVESAVIHLDNDLEFRMTVGDVAEYLSKTPAQITTAMCHLVGRHLLENLTTASNLAAFPADAHVFPTTRALKTVPAFAELDAERLQAEIDSLHR